MVTLDICIQSHAPCSRFRQPLYVYVLCMYICIIYIYIYIYIYIHIHTILYIHNYMISLSIIYINIYIYIYVHTCIRTCLRSHQRLCPGRHTHRRPVWSSAAEADPLPSRTCKRVRSVGKFHPVKKSGLARVSPRILFPQTLSSRIGRAHLRLVDAQVNSDRREAVKQYQGPAKSKTEPEVKSRIAPPSATRRGAAAQYLFCGV